LKSVIQIQSLRAKIKACEPRVLAFNGKGAAAVVLEHGVQYGPQTKSLGSTVVFVLPSTSGALGSTGMNHGGEAWQRFCDHQPPGRSLGWLAGATLIWVDVSWT